MDRQQMRNFIAGYPAEPNSRSSSDNIAIVLCTYFSDHPDRPDPDPNGEHGWGAWVERMAYAALDGLARDLESLLSVPSSSNGGEK